MEKKWWVLLILFIFLVVSFLVDSFVLGVMKRINLSHFYLVLIEAIFSLILIGIFYMLFSFSLYKKGKKIVCMFWSSMIGSGILNFILKLVIGRERILGGKFYPLIRLPDYSFPSLHVTLAFVGLPFIWKYGEKIKWYYLSYAILVGLSRLCLKEHYLSDVVGGVFLGMLVSYVIMEYGNELFKIR